MLRVVANPLIAFKVMYGIHYITLSKRQKQSFQYLNRSSTRAVTGLQKFATVENLHIDSGMDTLVGRAKLITRFSSYASRGLNNEGASCAR